MTARPVCRCAFCEYGRLLLTTRREEIMIGSMLRRVRRSWPQTLVAYFRGVP